MPTWRRVVRRRARGAALSGGPASAMDRKSLSAVRAHWPGARRAPQPMRGRRATAVVGSQAGRRGFAEGGLRLPGAPRALGRGRRKETSSFGKQMSSSAREAAWGGGATPADQDHLPLVASARAPLCRADVFPEMRAQ